jgi:tetratricopeptide (TPR) repeat protein
VTPVWRRFSLLLGTALIAFTTSCSVLDRREQDLFEKSRTALAAGDRHTALAGASNLLEAHPGYLPARLLRGEALFALGRHEEALKDLERTAHAGDELDDDDLFAVHYYSGRALLELGRGLVPDAQLRRLDVDPESLRKARDRFVAANRELVNALKVKPDDYDAVLWRGYSFLRLENHRKATDVLKRCAELDPARWEHRFLGALALEGLYRTNTQSLTAYLEIAAS